MTLPLDLSGKRVLIVGIANADSIAYGCALKMREAGASLAITYLNAKAEPHVRPLAEALGADLIEPLDASKDVALETLFQRIGERWGALDVLLHSIAFAPKDDLHGRVTDCSRAGFAEAMDISCHSFMRMARLAEPLMHAAGGGSMMTVSYLGGEKVVEHYGLMGPVKAALESAARYMAYELGPKNIRVNVLSPGAILTRAAGGIEAFDHLLEVSRTKAPLKRVVSPADVGAMAAFLASDLARNITGAVHFIDAGYEVVD